MWWKKTQCCNIRNKRIDVTIWWTKETMPQYEKQRIYIAMWLTKNQHHNMMNWNEHQNAMNKKLLLHYNKQITMLQHDDIVIYSEIL